MSTRVQHRLFPGFAGVALADILANSVAIILLMVVITMMIKHEQEEMHLEQIEDMSVLLSRNIATSVVMNALPTSPPARLHDYDTSPLDRNPSHRIMPIIEIHGDYVRNYYNGKTFSRDELLLQNNAFDKYLKRLDRTQRNYLRMDIYDIRLFYIVMSILKDYDARPKHWHFIGYPSAADGTGGDGGEGTNQASGETRLADEDAHEAGEQTGDGKSDQPGGETRQGQEGEHAGVPQNVRLDSNAGGLENYPYDDLAYESGSPQRQELPEDLPGSLDTPADEWTKISDSVFEALAQMMTEGAQGGQPQTRVSRFRSARASGNDDLPSDLRGGDPGKQTWQLEGGSMRQLLPALFEFMRQVQEEADAGGATRLAEYNFLRDILPLLEQRRVNNPPPYLKHLFDRLSALLQTTPEDTDAAPTVAQKTDPALRAGVLSVPLNDRIATVTLTGNELQKKHDGLPAEATVSLHFGLYPTIYQGVRAPLSKDALLLMHPQQEAPDTFRWRVVTLVSPAVDDFMTAFVYSALDDEGRLLIALEENALDIDNYRVATNYPVSRFRNERWLLTIYGIPALLLALGVLRRSRKTT